MMPFGVMANAIMLYVKGNFYSTKPFKWIHDNGIRIYDEQHGVVENTYVVPDTNLAILYNLDEKKLNGFLRDDILADSGVEFGGLFEADSLKSVIEIYEKGKSELIGNARKDAVRNLQSKFSFKTSVGSI